MNTNNIGFHVQINDLSRVDNTDPQNLSLSLGLIWTGKCIDINRKINDLSRRDKTDSQNLNLNLGSIWT